MLEAIKALLGSKKFLVMLAGIIVAVLAKVGVPLDPDLVNQVVGLAAAYIVGQGIADHGKEAAKVGASPPVVPS